MKVFLLRPGTKFNWLVQRNEGRWYAVCSSLKLIAVGKTYSDLEKEIAKTTDNLFKKLLTHGTISQYLGFVDWEEVLLMTDDDLEQLGLKGARRKVDLPGQVFEINTCLN